MGNPLGTHLNIISIFCNFSLAAADNAQAKVSQQTALSTHISALFAIACKSIGQSNRIIVVKDQHATVTYTGTQESAMVIATEVRERALANNPIDSTVLSVKIGIHVEPLGLVNEIKQHPNYIVNGIQAAKQLAETAQTNAIVVSPSYEQHVATAKPAKPQQVDDLGVKHEQHIHDYQMYLTSLSQSHVTEAASYSENQPLAPSGSQNKVNQSPHRFNYALACLCIVLVAFLILQLVIKPSVAPLSKAKPIAPRTTERLPPMSPPSLTEASLAGTVVDKQDSLATQTTDQAGMSKTRLQPTVAPKKIKHKPNNSAADKTRKTQPNQGISWESFKNSLKQGQKHACTQAEKAMNQCR